MMPCSSTWLLLVVMSLRSVYCDDDWQQPIYHISPQHGWMSDPTGIVPMLTGGTTMYHFFFDSNPKNTLPPWDPAFGYGEWSHLSGDDMVKWQYEPATSIKNGTGGIVVPISSTVPYLAVAFSGSEATNVDGVSVWTTKKESLTKWEALNNGEPVVTLDMVPKEVRAGFIGDSYAWYNQTEDEFYLLIGSNQCPNSTRKACTSETKGSLPQALLFQSMDLQSWNFTSVFWVGTSADGNRCDSVDTYGLNDGRQVFMYLAGSGTKKAARPVWMLGNLDSKTKVFTMAFKGNVDLGEVSATRSFFDSSGRRILFGWIPTPAHGAVAGTQTLPREIIVEQEGLAFAPIEEISSLRGAQQHYEVTVTDGTYGLTGVDTQSFELAVSMNAALGEFGKHNGFGIQLLSDGSFLDFVELEFSLANSSCNTAQEENTDTTGSFLSQMTITNPADQNPTFCNQVCCNMSACGAWTYVNPQPGTTSQVNCWLKKTPGFVPNTIPNTQIVSGSHSVDLGLTIKSSNKTLHTFEGLTFPLDLRVFVDRTVVEVFLQGQALTSIVLPSSPSSSSARLFTKGGSVAYIVDAWNMQGAFEEKQ